MSTEEVIRNLHHWEDRVKDACLELMEYSMKGAENWARDNARWIDQTGQARSGITGTAEKTQDGVKGVLAGTVQHSLYLELANGRRFAIIEEAIRNQGPQIIRGLKDLLK
jgi:hypothetical protein